MNTFSKYLKIKFGAGSSTGAFDKGQDKIAAYVKAMVKVLLPLGIALLVCDCMAKTEVAKAFEDGISKFDGLVGRAIYTIGGCLVAGGGIMAWQAKGDSAKAITPVAFGLGLPTAYEVMGSVHTLLV